MIINTIENKLDILSGYDLNDKLLELSLIEAVIALRKNKEIADLIFLARNSKTAFYTLIDRFGSYLDCYRDDAEEDGIRDYSWDTLLSSLLIILVETDQVVATLCSVEALKEDAPPLLLVVARTYLLEGYHARSRVCKSA